MILPRNQPKVTVMTNFGDLLNRPVGSAEKPKPLPVGSYYVTIKAREFGESSQRKTPFVRFKLGIIQAGPDVDAQLLAEIPNAGQGKELNEDFYITPDAEWRLHEFLTNVLGIQGMTTQQAVDAAVGQSCIAVLKQELDKNDPSRIYTRVQSFLRAA